MLLYPGESSYTLLLPNTYQASESKANSLTRKTFEMPSTRSDIHELEHHGVGRTPSNAVEPAETATTMTAAEGAQDEIREIHQIERALQLVGTGADEEGEGGGMEGHFRASNMAPHVYVVFMYVTAFVLLLLRVLLLRAT